MTQRSPRLRTALLGLPLACLAMACADATPAPAPGAPWCPPNCAPPQTAAGATGVPPLLAGGLAPGTPGAAAAQAEGSAFDPTGLALVLEDPRLAAVRASVEKELYQKAAQELGAALAAKPEPTTADRRAWHYQLGRLRALAGDANGAAQAFDEAAKDASWALADYARFGAAQALVKAGQYEAALTRARAVAPGIGVAGELDLVLADALAGKGDIDGAAERWRAYLGRDKRPGRWVEVTLRFARALLGRPSEAHADEAVQLAQRVMFEAPGGAGADDAKSIEQDALRALPFARRKRFESPVATDLLAHAKGLLQAGQLREAMRVTDALVSKPTAEVTAKIACDAWIVRADALSRLKRKAESADAYGDAMVRCEGQERRIDALYGGARASVQGGRPAEAVQRFGLVEKEFPKHALADDARLKGARTALEMGDEARFTDMLTRMPDDYPAGDMVNDGLFELAMARIEKRDWAGAVGPLEKGLARAPRERAYYAAGRFPYYLGRARIETGSADKGMVLLGSVVRSFPLSYYMALAYARLAEKDAKLAAQTLEEAVRREPEGHFVISPSKAFAEPAFLRAVELARQGEPKLARGELDLLGVGARTAPAEVLWAAAFLLSRAGAPSQSHGILRSATSGGSATRVEVTDWLDHYPSGVWRAPWEIAYPRPFADVVAKESARSGIPQAFAYAIMREESAFEPRVVSPAAAYGLMQLIVPTAKKVAKPLNLPADAESLKRPEVNVALGCRYLSQLRSEFPDNPLLAIPGYNAGGGAPKKWVAARPSDDFDLWVERIPYEETRLYTKRVIGSMAAYEFLYTRDLQSEARTSPLAASPASRSATIAAPVP